MEVKIILTPDQIEGHATQSKECEKMLELAIKFDTFPKLSLTFLNTTIYYSHCEMNNEPTSR